MVFIDPNCPYCVPPEKQKTMQQWLDDFFHETITVDGKEIRRLKTVPFKFDDQTQTDFV